MLLLSTAVPSTGSRTSALGEPLNLPGGGQSTLDSSHPLAGTHRTPLNRADALAEPAESPRRRENPAGLPPVARRIAPPPGPHSVKPRGPLHGAAGNGLGNARPALRGAGNGLGDARREHGAAGNGPGDRRPAGSAAPPLLKRGARPGPSRPSGIKARQTRSRCRHARVERRHDHSRARRLRSAAAFGYGPRPW